LGARAFLNSASLPGTTMVFRAPRWQPESHLHPRYHMHARGCVEIAPPQPA
jgi:hypothetical protein